MDEVRQIPPLETFFANGGVAVVLRPVSIVVQREGGGADVLSLEARHTRARVRAAASLEAPNLVLASPDRAACGTLRQKRWPMPVLVPELALPPFASNDGWIIREAYETYGDISSRMYLDSSPKMCAALTRWASAASEAIERALRVRMVHRGRIVICGGDPFIGLIASHLVPKNTRDERAGWMQPVLNERVNAKTGFVVNRSGEFRGIYEVKSLYVGPPPVPREARTVRRLPLPGSGK